MSGNAHFRLSAGILPCLLTFTALILSAAAWGGGVDHDCCWAPSEPNIECFGDLAMTQPLVPCPTECYEDGGVILPIICSLSNGVCTECDCDDTNASISPEASEVCSDGDDNDCDGLIDGTDPDCGGGPTCGDNLREGSEECDGTDDAACPGECQFDCTCLSLCDDFLNSTATVAIHRSETTEAAWGSLGGPHDAWQPWHVYGFLMEQLRSDGTPFDVVSDAEIDAGNLMDGGTPKYAILFSLANDCMSDATAAQIRTFVGAGGHAFIGSTTMTRDETCVLRGGGGGGAPIYPPAQVAATAETFFPPGFLPSRTIDTNCTSDDVWLNEISDPLPTWLQYEFQAVHTISEVVLVHATYGVLHAPYNYLIEDYEVQLSSDGNCGAGDGFVTVATNTGNNVIGEIQSTAFAPTAAKCIRINALSSYQTGSYPPHDVTQWIGLNSFQAIEDGTGNLLIDHPCAATGALPNEFALSELGLTAGGPIQIGDIKRTGVSDPLVSHLEDDTVVRGWKLAGSAGADCYNHPTHWAQQVGASSATVLAATGVNDPILTVNNHGAGRFIYHSEFNPLAGYSMHTIANFVYGFYRNAIDEAHAATSRPNVRLGTWPWPKVAGFMTRHDHLSTYGFDGVPGTSDDPLAAEIEESYGVQGAHLLYAGADLPDSGELCTDPSFGNTCDTAVQNNMSYMSSLGAEFGPHYLGASYLDRLQAFLGYRPTVYVASGACGVRDSHKQALVDLGILTKGDVAFGAHPHFALRIDGATEYNDAARFPLVDMPATGYYGTPGGGGFAGGIWAHEITSNPAGCNNDGTVRPCMEKASDFQYGLGGLINLYDHIGDNSLANPDPTQFGEYINYAVNILDNVYITSPLDLHDWWLRRDPVRIATAYDTTGPLGSVTVDLSCAADPGPFSVEVDLPWTGGAAVEVDGSPSSAFEIDADRIRVSAPAPSQVVITEACQNDADCDDADACNGVETCDIPSGACLPGTPVICQPASPPCEGGEVCNPSTGACDPVADPALGTPCEADGNLCTNDHCDGGGSCVLESTVSCARPRSRPARVGSSATRARARAIRLPDPALGTPCEADGNLCTNDHCNGSGSCVLESTVSCAPAVPPCEAGQSCNPGTGNCINEPDAPSSTSCDADGNPQTIDHCDGAGSCVPMPTSTIACQDGLDNDGDGLIDYPADPGCSGARGRKENPQCNDGIDNDGDTLIDYPADPECVATWSPNEAYLPFNPGCGLGVELTLVLAPLLLHARRRRRS